MSSAASDIPFSARSFSPGKKISGCYVLDTLLFETPIAVVWKAHDELLDRDAALYFLPDSIVTDEKAIGELREQVRLNRQVLHPGIVRVYDLVEDTDCAAISMDLVDARTISDLQAAKAGHFFSPSEIKKWLGQFLRTCDEAHDAHLIHRDISPDTILIKANGDLVISGFGISRTVLDALSRQQPNRPDPHLGYMSPQLLDGEAPARTDDVYSWGALVFTLLTGKPPFSGKDAISQIRKVTPPTLNDRRNEFKITSEPIPPAWEKGVAACLAKHTDTRPKNFKDVGSLMGVEGVAVVNRGVSARFRKGSEPEGASKSAEAADKPAAAGPIIGLGGPEPKESAKAPAKTPDAKTSEKPEKSEPAQSGETAPTRISPFQPQGAPGSTSRREETDRKGVFILLGLIVAAIALILAILKIGGEPAKKKEGPSELYTVENSARSSATPAPELNAPVIAPGETPSPATTSAAPTPSPVPAMANAEGSPTPPPEELATPAPTATEVESIDDPNALDPAQLTAAIAEAERVSALLQAQKAKAEAEIEASKKAAKEANDALPKARKSLKKLDDEAKKATESQQKLADEAEAAKKAAEEKAAAATESMKAVEEKKKSVETAQTGVTEQEKSIESSDELTKVAEGQLKEVIANLAAAQAQQAELIEAQKKAVAKKSEADAEAKKKTEESRLADEAAKKADAARQEADAKQSALKLQADQVDAEKRTAAAQKSASDAASLAEQAKKALEEAERLRIASADAQKKAGSAAESPDMTLAKLDDATPKPADITSATASPAPKPTDPPKTGAAPSSPARTTNSLGMQFAPVADVLFSIWPTRLRDYREFANATGRGTSRWSNPGFDQDPNHPVVYVTWLDAIAFCQWLTEKEQNSGDLPADKTYRLPTDLEWSKAVGLGDEEGDDPEDRDMGVANVYPWGSDWPPPDSAGNYTGEETGSDVSIPRFKDGFVYTSPVGSFAANQNGIYDMGGNVWEWCMDWWNPKQTSKVLRGGSWYNGALKLSLLSSCRVRATPDSSTDNYGFRVVISTVPKADAAATTATQP